jgi:acetyltransferase-like isoleucine patch superfamily enzyme
MNQLSLHLLRVCWERVIRLAPHPRLRAMLFKMSGASVGQRARIGEIQLANCHLGFTNLVLGDDCFVGDGALIDVTGKVILADRATLSPRCIILSHADPGSMTGNVLAKQYPRKVGTTHIGEDAWIGAGAIVLCGVQIGARAVIGAGSVITKDVQIDDVVAGNPARSLKNSSVHSARLTRDAKTSA